MATNRKLRTALLSKLRVTPQRLSQRVASIKSRYGPMSTEDGTYLLAHLEGVDLSKYLSSESTDRIRGMVSGRSAERESKPARGRKPADRGSTVVRIAPEVGAVDPLLPASVIAAAKEMAAIYPRVYVLENSIRNVISRVLHDKGGKDWWERCAPKDVQDQVQKRKESEKKKPWHGKRGAHEIYYSDFSDLRKIIEKNWSAFEKLFPTRAWITQKLDELEPPRNVVAHNNPLNRTERHRVELIFSDWMSLVKAKRADIPSA